MPHGLINGFERVWRKSQGNTEGELMGNRREESKKDGQAPVSSETKRARRRGFGSEDGRSLAEEASWVILVTQGKPGQTL